MGTWILFVLIHPGWTVTGANSLSIDGFTKAGCSEAADRIRASVKEAGFKATVECIERK